MTNQGENNNLGEEKKTQKSKLKRWLVATGIFLVFAGFLLALIEIPNVFNISAEDISQGVKNFSEAHKVYPPLDVAAYDQKLIQLANVSDSTSTLAKDPAMKLWPVTTVYPNPGAILPFKRIVAYYGNFYSPQMGVLGEYPPAEVLKRLTDTAALWQSADPSTPVIPAIDYIAVAAQNNPGSDGKYRLRMPPDQINKAIQMAGQVNGLVFLDVQVGLSNVQTEVPLLKSYLELPQVELCIDPEFSMKTGARPGTAIGTFDAADINFTANYLAQIVKQYDLPPKILVVHRFTQAMVTNSKEIKPLPEVQIVMDMDGFGPPAQKIKTYDDFIQSYPVQFTGFKLFYKNDANAPRSHLMTPQEVLKLSPEPSFIQYQ